MRLIVTGGRDFTDSDRVYEALEQLQPELVICGGCRTGADMITRNWAYARGRPFMSFPAQWTFYRRSAGPIRNKWMMEFSGATHILAFPGGKGTADTVRRAREAGILLLDKRGSTV